MVVALNKVMTVAVVLPMSKVSVLTIARATCKSKRLLMFFKEVKRKALT